MIQNTIILATETTTYRKKVIFRKPRSVYLHVFRSMAKEIVQFKLNFQ